MYEFNYCSSTTRIVDTLSTKNVSFKAKYTT